jgi:spore coat polysaccharide biosynthesis protein SpsF (cytidylyltransferase family)
MTYDDIVQQVGLCIIARFQSERLPGKALVDIAGKPSLAHLFERTQLVKDIAKPVLCTSTNPEDDKLAELAFSYGINVIRGDSKNVLSRLVSAIDEFGFDIVLRVTGDDILFDPYHAELLINYLRRHNLDYVSAKDLPGGTEAEAFTSSTLKTIEQYAEDPDYTEYLTYYVEDPSFACGNLPIKEKYRRDYSLSLDTLEDLQLLRKVFQAIYSEEKPYTLDQVLEYLDRNPSQLRSRRHNSRDSSKIKMKTKLNFGLA